MSTDLYQNLDMIPWMYFYALCATCGLGLLGLAVTTLVIRVWKPIHGLGARVQRKVETSRFAALFDLLNTGIWG